MDAAAGRIPTVVIQHSSDDLPIFRKGSKEWELHSEVAGRPRDLLIQKSLPGSFTGTPLQDWLRQRGIETVMSAG
jgi:nicotinamidase-related amidase